MYISIVFYGLLCADILNRTRLLCKNDNLRYFVFCGVGKITKDFFHFFPYFFLIYFFCICPKLQKDKSNRCVGIKTRHLAGQTLAGFN